MRGLRASPFSAPVSYAGMRIIYNSGVKPSVMAAINPPRSHLFLRHPAELRKKVFVIESGVSAIPSGNGESLVPYLARAESPGRALDGCVPG